MDAYLWLAPCLILLILFVLMPVLEVFRIKIRGASWHMLIWK